MIQKLVTLGAPAAERDTALQDCFVTSEAFASLVSGDCSILIGNRGSGKSALFERYAVSKETERGHTVIRVEPDNYSYEMLQETLAKEIEGAWAKQGAYAASWKFVLLVQALRAARNTYGDKKDSSYKKIDAYLNSNFRGNDGDILQNLLSYMKRFEELKIGSGSVSLRARELQSLYKLEELDTLQKHFKNLLHKNKITILVDELDRGWDASEDARLFVAGLFQAAMALNSITPHFRVCISVRREIYDNIPEIFDDAQKYRDLVRIIEWTEDGLKEVAATRIKKLILNDPDCPTEQAWLRVFEQKLSYRQSDSFRYMCDRTLLRPREIIQFCNECLASVGHSSFPITYAAISAVESKYSTDRFTDICSEYKFQFPNLKEVLSQFRGRVYSFTIEQLDEICLSIIIEKMDQIPWLQKMESKNLISCLWTVGFIRGYAVGAQKANSGSGSRWIGVSSAGGHNPFGFEKLHVHPMFRSYLNMKEK